MTPINLMHAVVSCCGLTVSYEENMILTLPTLTNHKPSAEEIPTYMEHSELNQINQYSGSRVTVTIVL